MTGCNAPAYAVANEQFVDRGQAAALDAIEDERCQT
jgi:hypothetical protein